jgi:type I restriction enzyme, S subunit
MTMDEERGLPHRWALAKIEELVPLDGVFVDGDWVESKDQDTDGDIRLIQLADIGDGTFLDKSDRHLTTKKAYQLGCTFLKTSDILVARMPDPLGRCCIFPLKGEERYVTVVDVCVIRLSDSSVAPKYFSHLVNSPRIRGEIAKYQSGSTRKRISRGNLSKIRLPIAPLPEQRRIVAKIDELFSELDKGVESLTIAREQLKAYRQSALKHAFEGKLTEAWRKQRNAELMSSVDLRARLATEQQTYHQSLLRDWKGRVQRWESASPKGPKPSRIRALEAISPLSHDVLDDLPGLPEGWVWERLAWMTCGVDYGTAAKSVKTGAVPVIRMGNLQKGRIDWADLVYTSDAEEIQQYQLQRGDVLFNRTNSPELVGKTALYLGERPAVFAGYLIRINHNPSVVDGRYLNLFLSSNIARQYGNSVKTDGVNQSNINGEKLQNYPFPFCSLLEQHEVVRLLEEKLSRCDHLISEIEEHLQRASALRQAILARAFSGQLVAQDPKDEPASTLLERIRAERESGTTKKERTSKNGRKKAA